MGTVILADVTELETIKISELDEALSSGETDALPIVKSGTTQKIKKENLLRFLESEYTELSNWLDNVALGNNGLTTVPEVVLTPLATALVDVEGGLWYCGLDKSLYVCTSDI
jgi:hypothetical protein